MPPVYNDTQRLVIAWRSPSEARAIQDEQRHGDHASGSLRGGARHVGAASARRAAERQSER